MAMIRPRKKGANIQRLAKMADSMVRSKALGDLLMVFGFQKHKKPQGLPV
jgi:hypothetical protein